MTEARLPDALAREAIERDLDVTLLVEAGAGSGKTTSLVSRMVALLAAGRATASSLVAVTFTRKAAAQLRQRFQIELEARTRGPESPETRRAAEALARLDQCRIGTIHAFCASLLLERPIEAGLDPSRTRVEQQEAELLSSRIFTDWIEARLAAEDEALTRLLALGVRVEDLERGFEDLLVFPDVEPVTSPVPARPDLGSAREELRAFLDFAAKSLPDWTPDGGWDEFQDKVRSALRSADLPEFATDAGVSRVLPLFEASPRVTQRKWRTARHGKDVQQAAERFREQVVKPALDAWRRFLHPQAIALLRPAVAEAVKARRERGLLAYEDLLLLTRDLLRDRPPVRRYFRERLTHLLVDEFQDTDPLQAELLLLLTAPPSDASEAWKLSPVPGSLFVVGDPKQSIYRFRRADIALYERFKERVLAGGGRVLLLTTSFRSAPGLARTLNRVLAGVLPVEASASQAAFAPLHPIRTAPGHLHGAFRLVTTSEARKNDELIAESAEQVARWVAWAVSGGFHVSERGTELAALTTRPAKPSDVLVLTRRKRAVSVYAGVLEKHGVAVTVAGSEGLSISEGLRALRPLLRAAIDLDDEVSAVAFLTGPLCGVDDSALYAFRKAGGRFSAAARPPDGTDEGLLRGLDLLRSGWEDARRLPPGAALARIIGRLGVLPLLACSEAGDLSAGNVLKVLGLARQLSATGGSFRSISERLDEEVDNRDLEEMSLAPARLDAARVMNVHKAKGLEAPIVILGEPVGGRRERKPTFHVSRETGDARGWFCLTRSIGKGTTVWALPPDWPEKEEVEARFEDAEEKRLLYVAATRAQETLLVNVRLKADGAASGPWAELAEGLPEAPRPEERIALESERVPPDLSAGLPESRKTREARRAAARAPTSAVVAVTTLARSAGPRAPSASEEAHGAAWGRVLHALLEAAMRDETAGLDLLAENLLREEELPADLKEPVLRVLSGVTASGLWHRARAAARRFVEVPFAIQVPSAELGLKDGPAETLLKGAIDLVFEENGVWQIVDYKSDAGGDLDALVAHYAPQVRIYRRYWETLAGGRARAGLFFLETGDLRWVEDPPTPDAAPPRDRGSRFQQGSLFPS